MANKKPGEKPVNYYYSHSQAAQEEKGGREPSYIHRLDGSVTRYTEISSGPSNWPDAEVVGRYAAKHQPKTYHGAKP